MSDYYSPEKIAERARAKGDVLASDVMAGAPFMSKPPKSKPSNNGKSHGNGTTIDDFVARLNNVKQNSKGGYTADCPLCTHQNRPHLSVDAGDDVDIITTCWAAGTNHSFDQIAQHVGFDYKPDNGAQPKPKPNGYGDPKNWTVTETYVYTDAYGQELYQVRRMEPPGFEGQKIKTFLPWTPHKLTGYNCKLPDDKSQRVLYRLPELYKPAHPDEWVLICEGEKTCNALCDAGFIATTSQGGAKNTGQWKDGTYPAQLEGRKIVVIADNDAAGLNFVLDVKDAILDHKNFADLRVIYELPGLVNGQDAHDWLKIGYTRTDLLELIENAPSERGPGEWIEQAFSMGDCYDDIEPTEYIIDDLLPVPSLTIGYGYPGSLKSMLFLDMACAVASGKPWLQDQRANTLPLNQHTWETDADKPDTPHVKPFHCQQAPVLWVDVDNSKKRTKMRARAIGKTYDVPRDGAFYALSFPVPGIDLSGNSTDSDDNFKPSLLRLIELIRQTKARLVVLDNLIMISGGADENSSQIGKVMSNLRYIAERANAAIVIIHHPRKSGSDGGRAGNALRGHSAIEGAIDLALSIHRDETSDEIQIISTKSRDVVVEPFGAAWRYKTASDSKDLDAACFFGTGQVEAPGKIKAKEHWALVRDLLSENADWSVNQGNIAEHCKARGFSRNKTLEMLAWREDNKRIERKKVGRSMVYKLVDESEGLAELLSSE